jgi:16S rRNA (cytosine1402-N4)-methyltransferase
MTTHKPVLLKEVIQALNPEKNQNFVDCTVGGGGHAQAILEKTGPKGKLLGIDWDPEAISRTQERLSEYKGRLVLYNASYTHLKEIVYDKKFFPIHGLLIDLGLSSDQLQVSGRGFSFQVSEPLDMRYSTHENELTAGDILNHWPLEKIRDMLIRNSDERFANRIAKAVENYRKEKKIENTLQLVEIVISAVPRQKTKIHPATKTFQALRMEVNNELNNVRMFLKDALEVMEPKTRLAVITFHSLEDRIVKQFFKKESVDCLCSSELPICKCGHKATLKLITKKPIVPSPDEISENFRCRSAKLRVVEKV